MQHNTQMINTLDGDLHANKAKNEGNQIPNENIENRVTATESYLSNSEFTVNSIILLFDKKSFGRHRR